MKYTLDSRRSIGYVRILVKGVWPTKKPEGIIVEMHQHWLKHKEPCLLIDIRNMEDTPTVFGDYENVKHFAKHSFSSVRRIAVLDNLNRKEANEFFETAAYNRGLRIRFYYADEHKAIDWLNHGEHAG